MVNTLDGRTIFVTNFNESSISVIDATTWKLIKKIQVPLSHMGSCSHLTVASSTLPATARMPSRSSMLPAETLVATVELPVASQPYGIGISADGRYVYASDNLTGRLLMINTRTDTYVGSVQIGSTRLSSPAHPTASSFMWPMAGPAASASWISAPTRPAPKWWELYWFKGTRMDWRSLRMVAMWW